MSDTNDPSTVAAEIPAPTQAIPFKEVSDEIGLTALPDLVKAVVLDLMKSYDVAPRAAAAVALHVAAAAIGSVASVISGSRPLLPGFNLVVALQGGRTPGWFDFLIAPLTDQIFGMQKTFLRNGAQAVEQEVMNRQEMLQGAKQSVNPDPALIQVAEDECRRLAAVLRPVVITGGLEAVYLERVMDRCFDGSVLLSDFGGDPVENLMVLKPAKRRQLASLLNLSWQGLPLCFGIHSKPGSLSALWLTYEANFVPLFESELTGGTTPAPLLCIRSPNGISNGSKIPNEATWKLAIEVLFRMRCAQRYQEYRLSEDAESRLRAFEVKINGLPLGEQSARHINWLPCLARRLALVFMLFDPESQGPAIEPEYAANAVTVAEWLGFEHLAVVQSFQDCGLNRPPADKTAMIDIRDPMEAMLRKIRQKAPVSRRKLWRSYDNPRAEWFHETIETLLRAGKIVQDDAGCFVAR